jgi:hypothetical protein
MITYDVKIESRGQILLIVPILPKTTVNLFVSGEIFDPGINIVSPELLGTTTPGPWTKKIHDLIHAP